MKNWFARHGDHEEMQADGPASRLLFVTQHANLWLLGAFVLGLAVTAAVLWAGMNSSSDIVKADSNNPGVINSAHYDAGTQTLALNATSSCVKKQPMGIAFFAVAANPITGAPENFPIPDNTIDSLMSNPHTESLAGTVDGINHVYIPDGKTATQNCVANVTFDITFTGVTSQPGFICIVEYHITGKGRGIVLADGPARNIDNSVDENGFVYSGAACPQLTIVTPTPSPTPSPSPSPTPSPNTDITVVKTDEQDPVAPGDNITYDIVVTNLSSTAANGVASLDSLPGGLTFVSAAPSQGTCSSVVCNLGTISGGGTATIKLIARANTNVSGTVTNQICVSTTTQESNQSNNCDTETTTILPPPPTPTPPVLTDITVVQNDEQDPVSPGDNIVYDIVVTNLTGVTANNVVALDSLPAGVTYVSSTPSQGTCSFVICNLSTLNGGASATIRLVVRVNANTTGTVLNLVCVSTSTPESNLNNNCDTETTTILVPTPTPPPGITDITVLKTDEQDPVAPGDNITYDIVVTNLSSTAANGVASLDSLPGGLTFISAAPSQGTCSSVVCNLGTIPGGGTATIKLIARANTNASGTVTNQVCVSTTTLETNTANNCDTETTTILPPPPTPTPPPPSVDITVVKIDQPDPVVAGANLTYFITVTNFGPDTANAVVAVDNMPSEVSLIAATPSQGTCTQTCNLGAIPAGGTATISLIVRVNPGTEGSITNSVCVSTTTNEPDQSNNCDDETTTVTSPTPRPRRLDSHPGLHLAAGRHRGRQERLSRSSGLGRQPGLRRHRHQQRPGRRGQRDAERRYALRRHSDLRHAWPGHVRYCQLLARHHQRRRQRGHHLRGAGQRRYLRRDHQHRLCGQLHTGS